jgi:hypothetical protein
MSELLLKLAGDATVRGTINADGDHVGSVYNFINLACNKRGRFAYNVWERLTSEKSVYKDELKKLVTYEYVKGLSTQIDDLSNTKKTRRRQTPVMTLRGLQRLMMILGGQVAAEFRAIVEGVFSRYVAGDRSMLEEIQANAVSTAPIHQAYRQALVQEPVVDSIGDKRRLERQDALLELELKERNMSVIGSFCGLMSSLNPDWKNDTRLRLQLEDSMKTAMFGGQQALITNGDSHATSRSISVSQVAQELGVRLNHSDSIAIGRALAAQYREQHGEPPSKHRQWVDGAEREVNSYTERDRHMVERVILAHTRK